jgi:molecular chaperone GrpE
MIGKQQNKHINDVHDLSKENEELVASVEDWKNKYVRALADYQNLEKRKNEEVQMVRQYAAGDVLIRLLSVVDTFERAQKHLQDTGLSLGLKELDIFFKDVGVEKISVIGKPFDPHEMECIEVIEGEENIVKEEVLPGYRFMGKKILRVAQVKVGKNINLKKENQNS